MKKLIIATETFPYGEEEKPFIFPELIRLREYYDITIISHADAKQDLGCARNELLGVKIVNFPRPVFSAADKIKAICRFLFDKECWDEIWELKGNVENRLKQLYQSISFYAQTLADQKQLRNSGLLSENEQIIYYSYWYTYFCYSMVREKKKHSNIKILTRTHGCDLYHERMSGNRQVFKHQMEAGLDRIVFACDYGKKYYDLNIRKNIERSCLSVCKLGIEMPQKRMEIKRKKVWHLLSCSNVIALKRIDLIIDGLSLINRYNIQWTHIGVGDQIEHMQKYAEQKLLKKENIQYCFKGELKNEDVVKYYEENQIDCFITTSSTEGGCPVSIQEAMSYGIPVIATAVGGITEMMGDNGILIAGDADKNIVSSAIETIFSKSDEELQYMSENSYKKWAEEFNINVSYEKIFKVLKDVEGAV